MRALLAFCLLVPAVIAQPAVGDPAPEIALEAVLGSDGPATLAALRGRAVVLELWATWCLPCIPALDHLAEVAAEVADEPVSFLAVTDEDLATVERFRARRPSPLPMGVDADSSVFDAYRPGARPQTILIAPDGRIAARTMPDQVTADVLRRLVAGEPLSELEQAPVRPDRERAGDLVGRIAYDVIERGELDRLDEGTVYKAIMRPFAGRGGGGISIYDRADRPFAHRRVTSRANPTALLLWAENAFSLRLDDRAGLPQVPWFADVIVPEAEAEPTMAAVRAEAVRLVERTFGIRVRRELRPTNVLRLERIEGAPSGVTLARERGTLEMRGTTVEAVGRPFSEFVRYLQWQVDRPIVDLTGFDDGPLRLYDFEMDVVAGVDGEIERGLRALGLRLVPEDARPLDTLVIEPTAD
ncbi:redoxin domain-containing protein [Rubrivirga sp. IMCC45206]|uniref:redoxin domain-containing protein n=1 Tax=Rubrivirga sp. IMCC45206 TaxID=3391614 RepID=UPI0039902C11